MRAPVTASRSRPRGRAALLALLALLLALPATTASRSQRPVVEAGRERCDGYARLRQPFFGETHSHTRLSFDAVILETRTGPRDAYRFAQGEPIGLPPYDASGNALRSVQLRRPLDWAVVTDHAEYFGETQLCTDPSLDLAAYDTPQCQGLRSAIGVAPGSGIPLGFFFFALPLLITTPARLAPCGPDGSGCQAVAESVWLEIQAAAEEAYDRTSGCSFTSFVGYEWTANTNQSNLHRNVIFRNEIVPARPTSYYEAQTPEQLHDALQAACLDGLPGCDALAIPHNSNLSQAPREMFDVAAATAEANAKRAFFEPLVEIYQHKGDSECRIGVGTSDELCGFEKMDRVGVVDFPDPNQSFPPLGFVRNGLLEGLLAEDATGVNPLSFGFVGGTDTHSNVPGATDEDAYPGHLGFAESRPEFRLRPNFQVPGGLDAGPGGLTVLWAEENSREALWGAMQRREAYATSGTRPIVRFFGAFHLPPRMCEHGNYARIGYSKGVPMGGDLGRPPGRGRPKVPTFSVLAHQDPGTPKAPGAPLQRVQIVKGWVDASGETQEAVYDVAGGGAANGADVDLATCTPRAAGYESLCTVWKDPDFDPELDAFYYARVVENPTCRWSTHECVQAGIICDGATSSTPGFEACCDPDVPKLIQERAWTSPIFYHATP